MEKENNFFSLGQWPGQKNQIFSLDNNKSQIKNKSNKKICYFCQKGFPQDEYDSHSKICEDKLKLAKPQDNKKTEEIKFTEEKDQIKIKTDDFKQNLEINITKDNKQKLDETEISDNFHISLENHTNNFKNLNLKYEKKEEKMKTESKLTEESNNPKDEFCIVDQRRKNETIIDTERQTCPLCFKSYINSRDYQRHAMEHLEREEEERRARLIQTQSHIRNANNLIYNNNDDSYNQNNYNNPSNNNINGIDFTNPNLGYEDLLRLDENITHPLPLKYLSMLKPEQMTNEVLSHLNEDMKVCLICFDEFKVAQTYIRIPCLHLFHEDEIRHWFERNKTCPVCRADIEETLNK